MHTYLHTDHCLCIFCIHLVCRVVQKNLVFVIGLSPRMAEVEVLKKPEYFGKFGKIVKVVINSHTVYTGNQVRGLRVLVEPEKSVNIRI